MAKRGHALLLASVLLSAMALPAGAQETATKAVTSQSLAAIVWPAPSRTTTQLTGGVTIAASQNTMVERLPDQVLTSATGGKTRTYVYKLTSGRLDISVRRSARSNYSVLVMAPEGLTGAVLGGRGIVEVDKTNVAFTSMHQAMLIGKGAHSRQLAQGQTLAIDRQQGGFHQLGLPKPPELFVEQGIALSVPRVGFETTVRFKPTEEVSTYQVALLKQKANGWQPVAAAQTQQNYLTIRGKETGTYAIVARVLNRFGVESEPSKVVQLRAIGVALPAGARITETGIFLSPTQHVQLLDTDGLRMSQGTGPYSTEAPSRLSLGRSKQTLVRLWDPNTQSKLHLQLFSQLTRAEISIGSPTATWPADEISATVSLVDGANQPLERTRGFTAQVSVNLKPVKVSWTRKKHQLSAHVPQPKAIQGPWIVRVEVKDQQGEVVGRDFLEVAKTSSTAQD
jgi:hypothetical protein